MDGSLLKDLLKTFTNKNDSCVQLLLESTLAFSQFTDISVKISVTGISIIINPDAWQIF